MSATKTELMPVLSGDDVRTTTGRETTLRSVFASTNVRAVLIVIAIFGGGFWLWNVSTERGWVSPLLLAPPEAVGEALGRMFSDGTIWTNLAATAQITILGLTIAIVLALLISFLFVFSESLRKAVYPMLIIIQTFPKVAIAPLIIAGFGYGTTPKVILAALMAFFPILVNALVGMTNINNDQVNLFRSVGASKWQVIRKLRIPNAISYLLPALNSAAVLALIGTIVAEFVSAREGMGFAIQAAVQTGSVGTTFALLFVLGCFGVAIWLTMAGLNFLLRKYQR
ncbi:ABC transporter permease [Leucobacter sp. NPDC077196]|uniref:ABC transporter permease n=1 Tax=Leucobacter sp. NPDC077196 TaxID=3154959 RepID=UPI0034436939